MLLSVKTLPQRRQLSLTIVNQWMEDLREIHTVIKWNGGRFLRFNRGNGRIARARPLLFTSVCNSTERRTCGW